MSKIVKKKLFTLILLIIAGFLFSCGEDQKPSTINMNHDSTITNHINQTFTPQPQKLTTDFATWYNYTYYHIILSKEFIALDTNGVQIDKIQFLHKLVEDDVVPFETKIVNGHSVFQLYSLHTKDESIRSTIQQMATTELEHEKLVGSQIPHFNFTDLNGKTYTSENTKGKLVVFKCWFIRCVACVKEFPELNKLVSDYKSRNDVLFISLAIDENQALQSFLQTTPFYYKVIPNASAYMNNHLHVSEYPTHILVDRKGKIVKVVNRIEELIPFLTKETELKTS